MASPAQIAANQCNAKKSTGPRTDAGKHITRNNATTHGLCSSIQSIWMEKQEAFDALLADLTAEYQPVGATEEIYVYKIAEQFAFSKRAGNALAQHTMANQTFDDTKQMAIFLRYYTAADRAFTRNLNELRKLQQERRQQESEAEIGSVSQTAEPVAEPAPPAPQPEAQKVPEPAPAPAAAPAEQFFSAPKVVPVVISRQSPQKQAA